MQTQDRPDVVVLLSRRCAWRGFLRLMAAALVAASCLSPSVAAAPLNPADVPEPLKPWVPWVLHGHEGLTCPRTHDGQALHCVWPSRLELKATADSARFQLDVQVFGAPAMVELPGEVGRWPHDVVAAGTAPLAVVNRDGQPVVRLGVGQHVVTGVIRWAAMPADLRLPLFTGSLQVNLNGQAVARAPDAQGRVLLEAASNDVQASDELTVRTSRLIDDDIPMRVTLHVDLAVAGKPREVVLPSALLPDFVVEAITSDLPARLVDGTLRVQARPGNYTLQVRSRLMKPTTALTLPAGQADELWAVNTRNGLRVVTLSGLTAVDPKQVPMPDAWRNLPAFAVTAGQTLALTETRRGDPKPGADQMALARQIWLDFDGGGYTVQDTISGKLTRSWRLEMAPGSVLGRVAADGGDQPVTRREGATNDGVELRRGALALTADSRIDGGSRRFAASGWQADVNMLSARLNLPPGWRLLHASGVDVAEGSWVSRWTLWDFFFVLLAVLAAGKLCGPRVGLLMAAALVLCWHMPGAPRGLWLLLLGLIALARVLRDSTLPGVSRGRLAVVVPWVARAGVAAMLFMLLPYAVDQVRLALHPVLEHSDSGQRIDNVAAMTPRRGDLAELKMEGDAASVSRDPLAAPAPAAPTPATEATMQRDRVGATSTYAKKSARFAKEVDPNLKVQTGPGLPAWQWNTHRLIWLGPVQADQTLSLTLLPPWATAAWRVLGLLLMAATLGLLARALPLWPRAGSDRGLGAGTSGIAPVAAVIAAAVVLSTGWWPGISHAASPPPSNTADKRVGIDIEPSAGLLDELRARLTQPPECVPRCADLARLRVEAQGSRIQLRLDLHALAAVAVPLPGQGAGWRSGAVTTDGKTAVVRRDAAGQLWVWLQPGIRQVVVLADVGDAGSVEIALPMPPQETTVNAEGWTVGGLDARGLATGALSLSRRTAAGAQGAGGATQGDGSTQPDALPPFVNVERTLRLGLRWTVDTIVTRAAPSRAPVRARIALMPGEAVNSEVVRVEDGHAIVQLGAEESANFTSTLKEVPELVLTSAAGQPQQVERWRLDPSAQWRVDWGAAGSGAAGSGSAAGADIAPVSYIDPGTGQLAPLWQPWPGERVVLKISKPAGAAGQTITIDRSALEVTPGLRVTQVRSLTTLRSSQGGNHRVLLPDGVDFEGVSLNGASLPIQPQGRELRVPITPGQHQLVLTWREPRGVGWRFATQAADLGASGVNASTQLAMSRDRVVLAVAGPRVGPAVLLWGVLIVWAAVAWALGRSRPTPLGVVAWLLLGLGLAQTELIGVAVVAGWFFALEARRRAASHPWFAHGARWRFNVVQLALALWTLLAVLVLVNAVRVGLLGYPDMMITGNGSSAGVLHWYQDRFVDQPASVSVVSMPVLFYRLAMLAWALWLAASVLRWVRWGWQAWSMGGYWRRAEAKPDQSDGTVATTADAAPTAG